VNNRISFEKLAKAWLAATVRREKLADINLKKGNVLQAEVEKHWQESRQAERKQQVDVNTALEALLALVEPENRDPGDELHVERDGQTTRFRLERGGARRLRWRRHVSGAGFVDLVDHYDLSRALEKCFTATPPGKAWLVTGEAARL